MDTIPVIITFKDILSNLTQKLALIISKKILFGQDAIWGTRPHVAPGHVYIYIVMLFYDLEA